MKQIVNAIGVAALIYSATLMAASYKGVGGQLEAYGTLTAAYYSALRTAETCSRYPALSKSAMAIGKKYRADNDPLYYDTISKRISELAYQNGGKSEQQRLLKEMESSADSGRKFLDKRISKFTADEPSCRQALETVKAGLWDLELIHRNEIDQIMGAASSTQSVNTYAGFRFGMSREAALSALGKSNSYGEIEHHDNFKVGFRKPPVEVNGAKGGTAWFKNNKLYAFALLLELQTYVDSKRREDIDGKYASFKARLTEKYGPPIRVDEPQQGAISKMIEIAKGKSEKLVSVSEWRDGDVVITLDWTREWVSGTLRLDYVDTKYQAEKEKDGL